MIQRTTIALVIILLAYSVETSCQPAYIDSLQQIVSLNKQDDAEMKALVLLAINCHRSDPDKAKLYLGQNIKMATASDNYDRQCSGYALFLTIYQEEGNTDSAAWCVNKLKAVAELAPDNKKVQGNYNQAMGLYYKKNGDYKAAMPYTLAAVKFTEESGGEKKSIAGQWLNAGNLFELLGNYTDAMTCDLKALHLFEETGNKLGQAFLHNNISNLYLQLKQYGTALKHAQSSLELKRIIADKRGICTSLGGIGNAYMGLKNMPAAFKNFESALKIAISEKMPIEETNCYFNMAKIFVAQSNDSLATFYFKKARTLATKMDNKLVLANTEIELSALYRNADSLKYAEQVLISSLTTFKEAGSLEKESDNYKRLSAFYIKGKQFKKALEYSDKYHAISDSISGINVQVQIKKLEEQYNFVKKEKEISLLKKDRELQRQELKQQRLMMFGAAVLALLAVTGIWLLMNRNKLKQRMKELELRNQIAADLHDEVGSSLSSIHMLSQMAITKNDGNDQQKNILDKVSSNAKETMDRMSDIVWMIKPGETGSGTIRKRMERFANEICDSKQIDLSLDLSALDNIRPTMEQRKNIYLIFKEAMNNAVKYSGTKKIEGSAKILGSQLELLIKDHGSGFDTSLSSRGNGLDNMRNRAKDSGGGLSIDSSPGLGTSIKFVVQV